VEDGFHRLPIHWMWWPALGGLAVGAIGLVAPRTLGVGYDNIEHILGGQLGVAALAALCGWKLVSWVIALGSGTSGGTLAPLFTIGSGIGAALGLLSAAFVPSVDPRVAALVGMAAIFAGASRALLASVVFAFETTRQPLGLLPLLGGCTGAFLISCLTMRNTIMTEKIARRGVRALGEYGTDHLQMVRVADVAARQVVTVRGADSVASARAWIASGSPGAEHQAFPVLDDAGLLTGVVTRREILQHAIESTTVRELVRRPAHVIYDDSTLREAADRMAEERVGRLPVVRRREPRRIVGIVTRSDLVEAHRPRLEEERASAASGAAGSRS
jgi:CBS domain-containing protein